MADGALSYDAPPVSGWPLSSNLELGVLSGSVPCARLHAHHVLREWSLAALSDDVELVVSELVTNAIKVSAQAISLWLMSDGMRAAVFVQDSSPLPPVPRDADEDSTDGRGLVIVDALAQRWGAYPVADGKIVWAVVC